MKHKYFYNSLYITAILLITVLITSCGKNNTPPKPKPVVDAKPVTMGLYEYGDGTNKRIFTDVTKVGTKTFTTDNSYALIFDTGSVGLTFDATDIIPASMITSSGITITGDSVTVNGITITNQTATMSYGDALAPTVEYGNLAYADFTFGDNNLGTINIKHVPFFLYYKVLDGNKNPYPPHSLDIIGVGPGFSFTNSAVVSPFSLYEPGTGLTKGFKLAAMNANDFTSTAPAVTDLLTVGLTDADRFSSGFIMHPLHFSSDGGYSPNIPASITYAGNSTAAEVLFDTGTPAITILEDLKANSTTKKTLNSLGDLPNGAVVSVTTNRGFKFNYTVSDGNLTTVENPNQSGDYRSIFSLDFFIKNEFLTDYQNNVIGLKNN